MERSLEGRIAVVTGAGRRVGRAIAEGLGARGAAVVVHYGGSRAGAEAAARFIRDSGSRAALVQGDLTDSRTVDRVFEAADELGGCDLLVNSAAIFEKRALAEIDGQAWHRMIDTNLAAPFFCCKAAAASMRRKGRGDIVNIVDVGGALRAWKGYAHYCAAKAGLAAVTRCLALELAPQIRVNAIAPGAILFPEGYGEEEKRQVLQAIPLQRSGSPEDIVQAVAYLVGGAPFITGQILAVDGGRSIA
jgi:pteridine reductase